MKSSSRTKAKAIWKFTLDTLISLIYRTRLARALKADTLLGWMIKN
jgi:hypothetical protein